ncbi:hypothetical protein ABES58_20035 [Paenibacillus lautus]
MERWKGMFYLCGAFTLHHGMVFEREIRGVYDHSGQLVIGFTMYASSM